ncbi:MAG TPA: aspartate--tRNA ligase [Candidatus Nealsonbacteria bacterium]|nr:aspartate--tRNA ligase [Candidatus Nealsonbacteria bacterium]HEB46714.1 aspartate--tRNA ligase [Candidatus Nealsonbacteria bacterium]
MKRILNKETPKYLGKKVKVAGWINTVRSHGKIIFVDLRDRSGFLQVIFTPSTSTSAMSSVPNGSGQDPRQENLYELAKSLRSEWVIGIEGKVQKRPPGMVNPKIETGQVEFKPERLEVFSKAKTLPFSIETSGYEISEEKRLKYRYLDLRRERMKENLISRQRVIQATREFLFNEDFIEVETPILTKSTPEGARDFLVPSRLQPGRFYALPQSPQQYKQLLIVGGIEKYFQIARCFRDEDPRADRQAEFTQIDIEMSFIEQKDILKLIENLYIHIVRKTFPEKRILKIPFPKLTYKEVIKKYKTDRPDLRKNKKNSEELAFVIVYDFPMFEWSKNDKRWVACHHPFTRPKENDIRKIKADPEKVLAFQYDFVLNGAEIGGGSLRSYRPEILEVIFEVMGHKKPEIKEKFGHLLRAFEYGVPPHGGIALGLERLLMILRNEKNIRETMAFPKTGDSRDPMMGVPSEVEKEQLRELHIEIRKKK